MARMTYEEFNALPADQKPWPGNIVPLSRGTGMRHRGNTPDADITTLYAITCSLMTGAYILSTERDLDKATEEARTIAKWFVEVAGCDGCRIDIGHSPKGYGWLTRTRIVRHGKVYEEGPDTWNEGSPGYKQLVLAPTDGYEEWPSMEDILASAVDQEARSGAIPIPIKAGG